MKETDIEVKRHSLSHVLAMAVLQEFPKAKLAIGPAIENGFYYDFELPRTLTPEDLPKIEKRMREVLKKDFSFARSELLIKEAKEKVKKEGQEYKLELIEDLEKEGAKTVSFYRLGDFEDLCAGPHVENTKELSSEAYKLTKISGAYWRGDEKRKMLQRIYGVAFENKAQLDEYLVLIEESKKRDHRKLGRELDLFVFSDLVGPGLPLFTPKGTIIIDELQKHVENVCRKHGFQKVSTPHLAKMELYETSGHKQKFGDELLLVNSHFKQNYVLKPVQCPHQTQIYASKIRSYRDLPIRYMESNKQYRDEKPGEISGLSRVIAITVEDGHTFCTIDQVKSEIITLVKIIQDFYKAIGLWNEFWVSLSVRDQKKPEAYIGEPKDWDKAEAMLAEVSEEMGLNAKRCEGEAALYGPKLDFMFKDALGREIQIPTVQLDFATAKRFNLSYINEDGKNVHPVMVHRAILGSYERFLVMLIEHLGGVFPLWLAPTQAKVIAVSDKVNDYANSVAAKLSEANVRVEIDTSNETVGKKIREAEMQKIPYMVVVGEKEKQSKNIAVRTRSEKGVFMSEIEEFIKKVTTEIQNKV